MIETTPSAESVMMDLWCTSASSIARLLQGGYVTKPLGWKGNGGVLHRSIGFRLVSGGK